MFSQSRVGAKQTLQLRKQVCLQQEEERPDRCVSPLWTERVCLHTGQHTAGLREALPHSGAPSLL